MANEGQQVARKDIFTIIEKGEGKKSYWCKVGSAWEAKDGSWQIVLDALPVNGRLNMRDPYEEPEGQERGRDDRGGGGKQSGGGYQRGGRR